MLGRALADRPRRPDAAQFVRLMGDVIESLNKSQLETLPEGVTSVDLMSAPSHRHPGHTKASTDELILSTQRHQELRLHKNIDTQLKHLKRVGQLSVGARVAVSVEHLPSKKSFADAQLTALNRKDGRLLYTPADYIVLGVNQDAEPSPTYTVAHVSSPTTPLAGQFDRSSLRQVNQPNDDTQSSSHAPTAR